MSGFSKEQLALAKQMQSGYVNNGTFLSQGKGATPKSSSPSTQASRLTNITHPVRSQPVTPSRPTNGLVRPLTTNKAATQQATPAQSAPAPSARPAPQPTMSPSPKPPMTTAPAVQPLTYNHPYTTHQPMPANLQPALTPTPMSPQVAPAGPTPTPAPTYQTASAAVPKDMLASKRHDAVAKAIKINQMGKPIKWNWTSEEPVVRELSKAEMEAEMEAMTSMRDAPPVIYDKPFHASATMKAPGLGGEAMDISPPHKVVGLKGSRHAQ